jgi:hypothetical protein
MIQTFGCMVNYRQGREIGRMMGLKAACRLGLQLNLKPPSPCAGDRQTELGSTVAPDNRDDVYWYLQRQLLNKDINVVWMRAASATQSCAHRSNYTSLLQLVNYA